MTEVVKGFVDYEGEEALKRARIMGIVREVFEVYGFLPAETPLIELEDFVKGDNKDDEAVSDVYVLKDKGKRNLALRYEFTFQLKRLMKNKKLPFRRYQIGEVFRDEPVKGNRTRQFTTCDADVVGASLKDEADLLAVVNSIMQRLGIKGTIYVNNRKLLNEILDEFKVKEKDRMQVIREIDKLDKLSKEDVVRNLKKFDVDKILKIFSENESYFKKYKAYSEIKDLIKLCKVYGFNVKFVPYLARGLSYYNGTVFEVKSNKIKETVFGGGAFMFENVQSVGFGASVERLSAVTDLDFDSERYLVVSLGQDVETIKLTSQLREKGKSVSIFYGKPSKALDYANSYFINKVIFVGGEEVRSGKFKVKDMKSGKENVLKI